MINTLFRISERRAAERREQYKLVREHVKRDDSGRVEAYGWSLPAILDSSQSSSMVPVPVCCRPLLDNQPSVKVWCSTGVTLRGGKTKDGAFITGEPIYFSPCAKKVPKSASGSDKLENEITLYLFKQVLGVLEADLLMDETCCKQFLSGGGKHKDLPEGMDGGDLGGCEWVELRKLEDSDDGVPTYCSNDMKPSPKRTRDFSLCETSTVAGPSDKIEVCYCLVDLAKVQAMDNVMENEQKPNESAKLEQLALASSSIIPLEKLKLSTQGGSGCRLVLCTAYLKIRDINNVKSSFLISVAFKCVFHLLALELFEDAILFFDLSDSFTDGRVGRAALPPHIRDAMSKYDGVAGQMSTALPTVWLGSQNQYIYVHSAVIGWKQCLRRIKMPDAVLSIIHYKGRVFAALANGTIAVFHRDKYGEWSDTGYHSIRVGKATSSVRSLCVVSGNIWSAYKNFVVVIDGENLQIVKVFPAHPRKDSQVRNMQWIGSGVWLTIRLDSTLRLYHAHTFDHLQDVDIEPYVTNMLGTSRLDFSYMRTTALLVSNRRLWIGTGTGVIISVPLSSTMEQKVETCDAKRPSGPGGLVRVYSRATKDDEMVSSTYMSSGGGAFIPYCNLTQAQLSFHGHKDSVKFFLAVPGAPKDTEDEAELRKMLVISGGDGYIDFRIGEESEPYESSKDRIRPRDMSHLIIWEVDAELPVLSK
uniref:LLGL domain-containing protein n=1 Tax=Heterorhabditis bacteriophora TaxID=37862 RepID=A0A1I7XPQ8_HETBA